MENSQIIELIKEGLIDAIPNLKKEQIQFDSHLKNELGLDSLSSMFFLTFLEDNLPGFEVNSETIEARDFNTVETIFNYIIKETKVTAAI